MKSKRKSIKNLFRRIVKDNIDNKRNPFCRTYSFDRNLSTIYISNIPHSFVENGLTVITVREKDKTMTGHFAPKNQPTEEDLRLSPWETLEIYFVTRSETPVQSNYPLFCKKGEENKGAKDDEAI